MLSNSLPTNSTYGGSLGFLSCSVRVMYRRFGLLETSHRLSSFMLFPPCELQWIDSASMWSTSYGVLTRCCIVRLILVAPSGTRNPLTKRFHAASATAGFVVRLLMMVLTSFSTSCFPVLMAAARLPDTPLPRR